MMKTIGNFMLGIFGLGVVGIALVAGFAFFAFAFAFFVAISPYLILGFLVAWAIKAITM